MDDRDFQLARLDAEFLFGIRGQKVGGGSPEHAAVHLRAEDVFQAAILQNGGGDACGDPHELLELIDARRHRYALR